MIILTADDERMARINIISMLNDMNLPSLNIIEASDGELFLEKIETYKPDIAFVDIKMPKLDGLNAIDYAKKYPPYTYYVIVTGFSEFDFAKKAIELKVDNYLLKPVDPEDLRGIISEFNNKSKTRNTDINRAFERHVIAKYHNVENIYSQDYPDSFPGTDSVCRSIIFIIDSRDSDLVKEVKSELFIKIRDMRDSFISDELKIAVFNISDNVFTAMCIFKKSIDFKISDYFNQCELTADKSDRSVLITCLRSTFETSDLKHEYSQLQELSRLRIIFGSRFKKNAFYYKGHIDRDSYLLTCDSVESLCSCYNRKKYINFINIIDSLKKNPFFRSLIKNKIYLKNISKFISIYTGFNPEDNSYESETWLEQLTEFGNTILAKKTTNSRYIDDVIDYINEYYMKDIGINTIADELQITPNYLSSLFHKEVKMKFTDYISKIRISRAKKLLIETNLTIKEISKQVGYNSTRHFTKLFVKYTDKYPSAYRKETE